jgi:hypothetical protein
MAVTPQHTRRSRRIAACAAGLLAAEGLTALLLGCPENRLICQVWSENSPYGQRTEFKVNWLRLPGDSPSPAELTNCWLHAVEAVVVTAPDGGAHALEKDFNLSAYSGEITQRWVLYSADGMALPPSGRYLFTFIKEGREVARKAVSYVRSTIGIPTDLRLTQDGGDLHASWTPPPEVDRSMWYKIIVCRAEGVTPQPFSRQFAWDSAAATLPAVPLTPGQRYQANVALFSPQGYAYSRRVHFVWQEGP